MVMLWRITFGGRQRWLEARAGPEFAAFTLTVGPLLAVSPRGDGHAVLVLPGLGGSDASTAPLRWFLSRLGYRSYGWGLGTNQGFGRRVSNGLDELLASQGGVRPGQPLGWSLGGVHAIELARRRPDAVRSIITLGSPLATGGDHRQAYRPLRCTAEPTPSSAGAPRCCPASAPRERRSARQPPRPGPQPCRRHRRRRSSRSTAQTWQPFEVPRWARRWLPPHDEFASPIARRGTGSRDPLRAHMSGSRVAATLAAAAAPRRRPSCRILDLG